MGESGTPKNGVSWLVRSLVGALVALVSIVGTLVGQKMTNEEEGPRAHYVTEAQFQEQLRWALRPIEQAVESCTASNRDLTNQFRQAVDKINALEVATGRLIERWDRLKEIGGRHER